MTETIGCDHLPSITANKGGFPAMERIVANSLGDISVNFPLTVFKLAVTIFTILYFQTL